MDGMNRRAFLSTLAAALTGAALDPERLLWVPGKKTIFLPPPKKIISAFVIGDVITINGVYAVNPVTYQTTKFLQQFVVTGHAASGDPILYPSLRR